jgi:phosphoribosylformylglycinamidine cyclo-ligase
MRALFAKHAIKGAAHITGGGITGNLPRVLPEGRRALIERSSWKVPPVFNLIQKIGGVAQREMDSTFNNGLGMIFVVGKKNADSITQTLKTIGEKFFIVGEIQNGPRGATIRS